MTRTILIAIALALASTVAAAQTETPNGYKTFVGTDLEIYRFNDDLGRGIDLNFFLAGDPRGGVTIIGSRCPDAWVCYSSFIPGTLPWTGVIPAQSLDDRNLGKQPPPPPPLPSPQTPPPPPKQTKGECVTDCDTDNKIRQAKCTGDNAALRRGQQDAALRMIRTKPWLRDTPLGGIPEAMLAEMDRKSDDSLSFCNGVAADAYAACLEKCQKLGWFLPLALLPIARRKRREQAA